MLVRTYVRVSSSEVGQSKPGKIPQVIYRHNTPVMDHQADIFLKNTWQKKKPDEQ